MKAFKAFTLVEVLISLMVVSLLVAAFAPTITKKHKKKIASQNSIKTECSYITEDCTLCKKDVCYHCKKQCKTDQYKNTINCTCVDCVTNYNEGCISCNNEKCKICNIGFYLDNGKCFPCPSGKYNKKAGSACDDCKVDHACSTTDMIPCESGHGANAGDASCTPCQNSNAACLECTTPTQCTKCTQGYYLSNGTCVKCSVNSKCDGTSDPVACDAGYGSDASGTTCIPCNISLPHCVECDNLDKCTQCEAGYDLDADGKCFKEAPVACPAGQYKLTDGTCADCPANSYCPDGITPTPCPTGTSSIAGSTTCTKCSSNIPGCVECSSPTVCTACGPYYYLKNGVCSSCSKFHEKCYNCTDTECTLCDKGYATIPEAGGWCIAISCPSYTAPTFNGCKTCPNGCIGCDDSGVGCEGCYPQMGGVFLNGNCDTKCSDYIPGCLYCSSTEPICTTCKYYGYLLSNGTCIAQSCQSGYIYSASSKGCVACSTWQTNCEICDPDNFCTKCASGYSVNANGGCTAN